VVTAITHIIDHIVEAIAHIIEAATHTRLIEHIAIIEHIEHIQPIDHITEDVDQLMSTIDQSIGMYTIGDKHIGDEASIRERKRLTEAASI